MEIILSDFFAPLREALSGKGAIAAGLITLVVIISIYVLKSVWKPSDSGVADLSADAPGFSERLTEAQANARLTATVLLYLLGGFLACYFGYFYVRHYGIESHITEWLNLILRWAHVVAGIAWIGTSFYFIFLENSLNRTRELREGIEGNLWAIHGGGFYYLEKYKVAPPVIPDKLHWFKYEAYFTWITGFALMWVVYYMNADVYMVDPSVRVMNPLTAVIIGIGAMVLSWFVYDALCRALLPERKEWFAAAIFLYLSLIAWLLCQFLSSRAAYIHVGSIIGTIMAANVFFVIIPSQKSLVRAAKENRQPDAVLGKKAALRSLHNNYFTLPVIFIMVSNHFPSTYGHELNWIILIALSVASIAVKHYWNLYEKGKKAPWLIPLATAVILAIAIVTSPALETALVSNEPVSFQEVQNIMANRCVSCHSAYPTDEVWKTAPNDIRFDTPEEIARLSGRIMARVVITRTMPQANKTGMTEEERKVIARWAKQGGKVSSE